MKTCKDVAIIMNNNEAKVLELLFKATGGGVCISSLTDILVENEILAPKTRTSWFGTYQAMSFEEYSSRNGILSMRIPNGMKFSGNHFTDPETGFKATMRSLLMLVQLCSSKKQVARVLMGVEKVSGYSGDHNYSSVNSVNAQFNKYFGGGATVIEKLKDVSISDIPEYLSLPTTKDFWRAYLGNENNWQGDFLLNLTLTENKAREKKGETEFLLNNDTIQWLKSDSESQRQQAKDELVSLFLN